MSQAINKVKGSTRVSCRLGEHSNEDMVCDVPNHLLLWQLLQEVSVSKLPPKVPGARDSTKVLLWHFNDLDTRSLAKAGQQEFHWYITVLEAFPFANTKEELCWWLVIEAAVRSQTLQAMLNSIADNVAIKRDLIDYVSPLYFLLTELIDFISRSGLVHRRCMVS